jgi:hypothetical protein
MLQSMYHKVLYKYSKRPEFGQSLNQPYLRFVIQLSLMLSKIHLHISKKKQQCFQTEPSYSRYFSLI